MKRQKTSSTFFDRLAGLQDIQSGSVNIGLLLLRIYAGLTIMGAGLDKLPLTDWMVDQVVDMGFPLPTFFAWIATFSEFAFGLLLVFGLMTRLSGIMLAITMGVAAFGFQKVLPIVDMHIAQLYFWSFVCLAFTGSGRYSLDQLINNKFAEGRHKWIMTGPAVLVGLLAIALIIEYSPRPEQEGAEDVFTIESINVPGTFNEWDPGANQMTKTGDDTYVYDLQVETTGPIEFKFTANGSWAYSLGESDQRSQGFPVKGIAETEREGGTENITAYIPAPGMYRIVLDSESFSYRLDSLTTQ